MEQPPHQPDEGNHAAPEQEQSQPGDIDLTGAVDQEDTLRDVIADAISEAEAAGDEVPEWGARTLARALANRLDDPTSGALHDFAASGRADKDAISQELARIYAGTNDDETREWVNRLGTYVVNRPEDPQPSRQPDEPDNLRVAQGFRTHGDAFRAFLGLPDIEPERGDLLVAFHEYYHGSYDSMAALVEAMTDIRVCRADVEAVAQRWGFDGCFVVDATRLEAVVRAAWDIVEVDGRLYVFSR